MAEQPTPNEAAQAETAAKAQNGQPQSAEAPPAGAQAEAVKPGATGDTLAQMEKDLRQAKATQAEVQDKWLRLQAEFENYKKRIQKEQTDMLRYAHLPLMKEMVAVMDHLELAANHARDNQSPETKGLLEGIDLVLRQMLEVFERFGLTRITAQGEAFDPGRHEAMGLLETETVPENHVANVFRAGYVLHERVVRPAMVQVAKKPAAPPVEPPPEPEQKPEA